MADDLTISLKSAITSTQLGYFPPSWSSMPKKKYSIDVWKEGTIVKNIPLNDKEYYVIGRNNALCDITLANPTVSRVHCILQHRDNGCLYIYDLKTAYGTFVNKNKIESQSYIKLGEGETFKIANSTKMFILNCEEDEDEDDMIEDSNQQISSGVDFSNTLQLMMKSTKDNIQFNNESNWGINDNDEEIAQYQLNEDNNDDNDININELLHKDNLTLKQQTLLDKITQLLNEREHIIKEKEDLKYADYDDNDNQKKHIERKRYYFTKRLHEIKETVESNKLKLSESLKAAEENSLRFNKKLNKESNDNDDEYYDRTRTVTQREEKTEVINYESMKATLESLIKEKQKYTDLLSHSDTKPDDKAKEPEIDSIDQYFIDNEIETKTVNIKDKLESIENEIKKTEKLLDYVTPIHLKIKRNAELSNAKNPPIVNRMALNSSTSSSGIMKAYKQPNKKKESISEMINKMNKIQHFSSNSMTMNTVEGNEGMNNEVEEEGENEEIQLDDEMIDKLNEYKNLLLQNENKDKKKKELPKPSTKKSEANLFKEIVANIGKSNFEVGNYPQIISRYDSIKDNKEKKDNKPIEYIIPNEDESSFIFQGKKRHRDEMMPVNALNKQQQDENEACDDTDSDKVKGKWIEETISDNPFNKYLNNNDNQS